MSRGVSVAVAIAGLAVLGVLARLWPHSPLSQFAPSSTAVYASDNQLLRLTLAGDQQYRLWTPLAAVSPEFVEALLLHEDRRFLWHFGVDPQSLVRAVVRMSAGSAHQGASTITMQLARRMYYLNTRSVWGKIRQMVAATWIELRYSKNEILEAHINLIPYGRNIQGVGAASLIYFAKPPSRLTFAEALALALIPQAPKSRDPEGAETKALLKARLALARLWASKHATSAASLAAAGQPLHFRGLYQLPFEAPHLLAALLESTPHEVEIHSTLNMPLQKLLERTVTQYIATQRSLGVNNAAAILLDYRSMQVQALVGSANFADNSIAGQVNGTIAKRSPGSALKPFIYALAMDQGLIHTQSILKDAPTSFGAYAPENFDGVFLGPVSAHDALIASRNIPAVNLSSRLAQPNLYQWLKIAGISRLASEQHYGLALALGGGEVSMEELVTLYAMLGNRGVYSPLKFSGTPRGAKEAVGKRVRLLSEEAAFMVLSILRDNPRPDGLNNVRPRVAWKTGTSWGFRDAWTVGLVGPYVLAVWVGNFDGSSNPAFVGSQVAAPLFFKFVDGMRASRVRLPDSFDYPPRGVTSVEVCVASGDLPNIDCPQRTRAWFIAGKSPIRVSSVHRRVPIDTRSGRRACASTPSAFIRSEIFEYWSSDILRLYSLAGMPRRRVPVENCKGREWQASSISPNIVFPVSGATYQLRLKSLEFDSMQLNATAGSEIASLYWFADGAYVGASRPSTPLAWEPTHSGEVTLSVVDDHGGAAARTIRVAMIP